ncbi:MAG: hypothetical protein LUF68_08415, partial [Clostridiales bacterium]|nr:hypothetical protein [Clostridiales bacterium]
MRQRTLKKAFSAVCLVLALCVAAYPAALAQETVESSTSIAAEETPSTEAESSSTAAEGSNDTAAATGNAASDATSDASVTTGSDNEADTADTSNVEQALEASASDASAQEETTVLTVDADSGGWTQTETGWTFFYWEDEAASEPTQTVDVVLYLEESVTNGETTFEAGCYSFDGEGALEDTGTGFVTAVSLESGKALLDESAECGGKLATVTTTQSDNVYSSVVEFYTGEYNGVYYCNGTLYTGFYLDQDTERLYYVTDGVPVSYTGKYETSNLDTYGETTFAGDGLWYYQ